MKGGGRGLVASIHIQNSKVHKAAQTDGGPGSSTGKTNYPAVFELGTFWPPKKKRAHRRNFINLTDSTFITARDV